MLMSLDIKQTTFGWGINQLNTCNAFISLQDNEVAMFAPNSTTRDIDNEEFNTISIIIELRDIRLVERDFNTINEVIDFLESFLFS